jgi:type IV pilus assembly protein PilC
MAEYQYTITKNGLFQSGKINADSEAEAVSQIKKDGWYIVKLHKTESKKGGFNFASKKASFTSFEKINFTDHLASSIGSGTPISEALEAYLEEGDKKSEIIDTINKDLDRGKKLSEAMAKFPETFSPLYIAMVQAGELTGSLDETLEYMANELRREHEFIARVKSAMFYPILVLAVALVVVIMVVAVVIPKIVEVTKSFGSNLPLTTRIISKVSELIVKFGPVIAILIAFSIASLIILIRDKKVKAKINARLLQLPLTGQVMKKYILARFLRIIGGCVKYGISLPAAFDISGNVVDNLIYRQSCERVSKKIIKGISLSQALSEEDRGLFPSIISKTIKGGERTGNVDVGLLRLSTHYETEVDRDLKRLTELIEPIMVVVLGVIVALIAISVIAPIYQMTSRIK